MPIISRIKNSLKTLLKHYLGNRSAKTNRHILCFDSDDWGGIRTPSIEILKNLLQEDPSSKNDFYIMNDCLESEYDINNLLDVLRDFSDSRGRHPVFTLNFVMGNPDFSKIEQSSRQTYYWEPFQKTYLRYWGNMRVFETIKQARDEGLFSFGLHCREHLNVSRYMRDLRSGNKATELAFANQMAGIRAGKTEENRLIYADAFNADTEDEEKYIESSILEAIDAFEGTFATHPKSLVCPCVIWSQSQEKTFSRMGFEFLSSSWWHLNCEEGPGTKRIKKTLLYTGKRTREGMPFMIRNCSLETSARAGIAVETIVEEALRDLDIAFGHRNIAIVNTHRVNYISSISKENGLRGLSALRLFLERACLKYPDIEFCSTEEAYEALFSKAQVNAK